MLDLFVSSISSKKGTTQAGVNYIKSQNIEKIIYTTLQKAYKRAKEIDSEKKNTKPQ
jgi:pyrroline-5-carboxylate reductase